MCVSSIFTCSKDVLNVTAFLKQNISNHVIGYKLALFENVLLRLLLGVVFELVAFAFIGVDVLATEMFSDSESESLLFGWTDCF